MDVGKYLGDILFFGGMVVIVVIFINDQDNANKLIGGLANTYTTNVKELSTIR